MSSLKRVEAGNNFSLPSVSVQLQAPKETSNSISARVRSLHERGHSRSRVSLSITHDTSWMQTLSFASPAPLEKERHPAGIGRKTVTVHYSPTISCALDNVRAAQSSLTSSSSSFSHSSRPHAHLHSPSTQFLPSAAIPVSSSSDLPSVSSPARRKEEEPNPLKPQESSPHLNAGARAHKKAVSEVLEIFFHTDEDEMTPTANVESSSSSESAKQSLSPDDGERNSALSSSPKLQVRFAIPEDVSSRHSRKPSARAAFEMAHETDHHSPSALMQAPGLDFLSSDSALKSQPDNLEMPADDNALDKDPGSPHSSCSSLSRRSSRSSFNAGAQILSQDEEAPTSSSRRSSFFAGHLQDGLDSQAKAGHAGLHSKKPSVHFKVGDDEIIPFSVNSPSKSAEQSLPPDEEENDRDPSSERMQVRFAIPEDISSRHSRRPSARAAIETGNKTDQALTQAPGLDFLSSDSALKSRPDNLEIPADDNDTDRDLGSPSSSCSSLSRRSSRSSFNLAEGHSLLAGEEPEEGASSSKRSSLSLNPITENPDEDLVATKTLSQAERLLHIQELEDEIRELKENLGLIEKTIEELGKNLGQVEKEKDLRIQKLEDEKVRRAFQIRALEDEVSFAKDPISFVTDMLKAEKEARIYLKEGQKSIDSRKVEFFYDPRVTGFLHPKRLPKNDPRRSVQVADPKPPKDITKSFEMSDKMEMEIFMNTFKDTINLATAENPDFLHELLQAIIRLEDKTLDVKANEQLENLQQMLKRHWEKTKETKIANKRLIKTLRKTFLGHEGSVLRAEKPSNPREDYLVRDARLIEQNIVSSLDLEHRNEYFKLDKETRATLFALVVKPLGSFFNSKSQKEDEEFVVFHNEEPSEIAVQLDEEALERAQERSCLFSFQFRNLCLFLALNRKEEERPKFRAELVKKIKAEEMNEHERMMFDAVFETFNTQFMGVLGASNFVRMHTYSIEEEEEDVRNENDDSKRS